MVFRSESSGVGNQPGLTIPLPPNRRHHTIEMQGLKDYAAACPEDSDDTLRWYLQGDTLI